MWTQHDDALDARRRVNKMVERLKAGRMELLFQWLEDNKTKLYRIGWSYLYNSYDIEDALHNTLIKIYTNIRKLKQEEYFETWCISIFINECKSILKHRKRTASFDSMETKVASIAESQGFSQNAVLETQVSQRDPSTIEASLDLSKSLNALEPVLKDILILQYIMGYTQVEVSKILSLPLGTVKSKGHRALKTLKELLSEKEVF